jgi:hypothetical protein
MAKRKKPATDKSALDAETLEYIRRYEAMPAAWQIADQRRRALETLLRWRQQLAKAPVIFDDGASFDAAFFRKRIRENQIRLLKLRAWRITGVKPGIG